VVCGKYRYFSEPPPAPLRCAPPRSACLRLSHAQRRYGPIIAVATHAPFATTRPGVHQLPPASSTAPLLWPARSRRGSPPCRRHPALDRGPDLGGVGPSWSWAQRRAGREQERRRRTASRQSFRLRSTAHGHWTVHTYTRTHVHTHMRAHTAQTMRFAGQALVRISDIGHEFCVSHGTWIPQRKPDKKSSKPSGEQLKNVKFSR
jgi:hypothetical protein